MHRCPAPGCDEKVHSEMYACRRHWYMIPMKLRTRLWRTYRDDGQLSPQHLQAMNACAEWLQEHAAA